MIAGQDSTCDPCPRPPELKEARTLFIAIALVVGLLVSGLVVVFVAYPHRGEKVPGGPWLGDRLSRVIDSAPAIHDREPDLQRRR